jgi:hypothetical protein
MSHFVIIFYRINVQISKYLDFSTTKNFHFINTHFKKIKLTIKLNELHNLYDNVNFGMLLILETNKISFKTAKITLKIGNVHLLL